MNATLERLKTKFDQALIAAFGPDLAGTDPILVSASNPKFGDYQSNVALGLAKRLGQPPRAIAQQVVQHLSVADICDPPTVAGPGFINLALKPSYLEGQLAETQADSRLGVPFAKVPKRVIIDYPSPNIAKEMHVGHLRPAVIGDCLSRVLEFLGHDVLRISHVGDWGTPFGMLIAYLEASYPQALTTSESLDLGDLSSFYRQAKQRFDADPDFREVARQAVVQLQAGDQKTLLAWKIVCQLSSRAYQVIYDLLGIARFVERGESFYNASLPEVVQELDQLGLLVEDQGAQCVFLEGFTNKEGKPLPLIVQKSDGGYNYAATDLAAIRYRVQVDQAQRVIYPVGAEQTNHFAQIFQVGRKAGWITDQVEFIHAPFGLVLGEDGSKLKTRSGEAVLLQDLLDGAIAHARADLETRLREEGREETPEFIDHVAHVVGIGAVKYADLSQNRTSSYVFSYDKALALQGNTAPYMIYAYVRVQGISRKIPPPPPPETTSLITGVPLAVIPLVVLAVAALKAIDTIPLFAPILELIGFGYLSWLVFRFLLLAKTRQELFQKFQVLREQIVGKKKRPIVLKEETELALAKHLLQFSESLESVATDLLPNRLCQYLFELSQKFNQFYDRCPVLTAPEPLQTSRLALCDLTAQTLRLGLSLLGIQVLERM